MCYILCLDPITCGTSPPANALRTLRWPVRYWDAVLPVNFSQSDPSQLSRVELGLRQSALAVFRDAMASSFKTIMVLQVP